MIWVTLILFVVAQLVLIWSLKGSSTIGIEGIIPIFFGVSGLVLSPLLIAFYYGGYTSAPKRSLTLLSVFFAALFPLGAIGLLTMDLFVDNSQKVHEELFKASEHRKLSEQLILVGHLPVGIHLQMEVDVPTDLLLKATDLLQAKTLLWDHPSIRAWLQESEGVMERIETADTKYITKENFDNRTHITFTSDFYPPTASAGCIKDISPCPEQQRAFCILYEHVSLKKVKEVVLESEAFGFKFHYPTGTESSDKEKEFFNQIPHISDPLFWQTTQNNIIEKKLRAAGYRVCKGDLAKKPELAEKCFCKQL